jgi:hypothetical protein
MGEIVQRIAPQFDPDKIILFGSQARGDAGLSHRPPHPVRLFIGLGL